MEHFEKEISLFVDNELPAEGIKKLFLHLAECDSCAISLNKTMKIKNGVASFYNELKPERLPAGISVTVQKNKVFSIRKFKSNWYYAAAVFLVFCFAWLINSQHEIGLRNSELEKELSIIKRTGQMSAEMIPEPKGAEKQHTSLPAEQAIKKTKIFRSVAMISFSKQQGKIKLLRETNMMPALAIVKITGDDFIGSRIVGN